MSKFGIKFATMIGGCAAVALSVFGVVGGLHGHPVSLLGSEPSSPMQTGVTITPSNPAQAPEIPMATPGIKGPAPLPPEEQGLPG
ncbi:hypothetical protein [Mycolicibacterium fortuitum]|uniref:hypothetical protein n=1 Tax=Mycolicibacterium fortuitum TaxID=1766 RepID=UPI0007E97E66|nr:hypothetical protein [Mycolicibacterium fortuitum]NOQ57683.1 hypothetical protein [Mycolicibacterium fortuitum]OBB35251.1 hypothetical protein A5763_00375 [Mycolicibacterium fortuitum]OBB41124.1 hypothetical protein A5754_17985 [Mycolicibacterium fortuitum]OBB64514.1 hypothetical protein A5755_21460 [Mycolicibacterium fortuitum]OBF64848.1 hypothetical protein A5751_04030 [Mycolicibacterium fortuitum]